MLLSIRYFHLFQLILIRIYNIYFNVYQSVRIFYLINTHVCFVIFTRNTVTYQNYVIIFNQVLMENGNFALFIYVLQNSQLKCFSKFLLRKLLRITMKRIVSFENLNIICASSLMKYILQIQEK